MKCSPPGYYQEFLEGLVKIDAEATRRFLVYAGLFEVVVHDMPREAVEGYIRELRSFYNNGWKEYF